MPLLTPAQLASIQKIGQSAMTVSCAIYKRQPYAHDDSNPFGDDTVTYADTPTVVNGWLAPSDSVDFSMDIMQVIASGNFILRVPVGTDIEPRDKVTIDSKDYFCSESTTEESWPEWITARLRRRQ